MGDLVDERLTRSIEIVAQANYLETPAKKRQRFRRGRFLSSARMSGRL